MNREYFSVWYRYHKLVCCYNIIIMEQKKIVIIMCINLCNDSIFFFSPLSDGCLYIIGFLKEVESIKKNGQKCF